MASSRLYAGPATGFHPEPEPQTNMNRPWTEELTRTAIIVVGFTAAGALLGHVLAGLITGLVVTLFMLYQRLYRFIQWFDKDHLEEQSGDTGIVEDLYYRALYLQKRQQDKVSHLEKVIRRFQESARALPDAVIILNERNEVEWLNKAAKKLVGLKKTRDAGQIISNLIRHPEFNRYLIRKDFKAPIEFPSPIDNTTQIRARIVPYGRHLKLLVIRDVTKIHNMEKMRQEFIASTSHELRTPLTVIIGYLESLRDMKNLEGNEPVIEAMLGQARRMESIIRDMLLLARLESLKNHRANTRKTINIENVIKQIRQEAEATGAWTHQLEFDVDSSINLYGNETEIHSAFSNLLQNALRYTPAKCHIKVSWKGYDKGAQYCVEDNGPGIAKKHLARLTERFYRVDVSRSRETGGTGLGLAIVEQIMKHHDGELIIESEIGKGSRFICNFPAEVVLTSGSPHLKLIG